MTDDLDRLLVALGNVREDDCGNNELCADALIMLAELRLNLRLTRKRLDVALSRATAAEEGRQDAMAALVQARSCCWPEKWNAPMTDDLTRYEPFAAMVDKTRGSGMRWIGQMREKDTGKWVRLDDVALLRMQADGTRQELAKVRAKLAIYEGGWSARMVEIFARAHDREEAAQMGEPDPWSIDNDDEEWKRDRLACVRVGLDALTRWSEAND